MATSQAQKLAVQKYRAKTYDTIGFDVRKGKRDEYKAAAAELGLSLAALLTNAAEEFIQNHAGEDFSKQLPPMSNQPQQKISELDKQLLNLPTEQKKALLKFLQQVTQHDAQQVNVAAENKAENTAKNASVTNHEPI